MNWYSDNYHLRFIPVEAMALNHLFLISWVAALLTPMPANALTEKDSHIDVGASSNLNEAVQEASAGMMDELMDRKLKQDFQKEGASSDLNEAAQEVSAGMMDEQMDRIQAFQKEDATTIQCFECNSYYDSACADVFLSSSSALQTSFLKTCEVKTAKDGKTEISPFCRKVQMNIYDDPLKRKSFKLGQSEQNNSTTSVQSLEVVRQLEPLISSM